MEDTKNEHVTGRGDHNKGTAAEEICIDGELVRVKTENDIDELGDDNREMAEKSLIGEDLNFPEGNLIKVEDLEMEGAITIDVNGFNLIKTEDYFTRELDNIVDVKVEDDVTFKCRPIGMKTDKDPSSIEFEGLIRETAEQELVKSEEVVNHEWENPLHLKFDGGIEYDSSKIDPENTESARGDLTTAKREEDIENDDPGSVEVEDDVLDTHDQSGKKRRHGSVFPHTAKKVRSEPKQRSTQPSFTCYHCGYGFTKFHRLKKHIKTHYREKLYECDFCDRRFVTAGTLKLHIRSHTRAKPFACNDCDYTCNTSSHLENHKRIHTGEKPFKCTNCDFRCKRSDSLKRHMKIHSGRTPYVCDVCDWKFATADARRNHKRTHTEVKPFACDFCDYRSNRAGNVKDHMRIHTGEKPFVCSFCDYRCNTRGNLNSHIRQCHMQKMYFECNFCEYKCDKISILKAHLKQHNAVKSCACESCGYLAEDHGSLMQHIEFNHAGENPFTCGSCSYRCSTCEILKEHEKTHAGQKLLACESCDYRCYSYSILHRHMKTHTGKKPFACDFCDYTCRTTASLKTHQIFHTGEKPFPCDYCYRKCSTAGGLKKHIFSFHSAEIPFVCYHCDYRFISVALLKKHIIREHITVKTSA